MGVVYSIPKHPNVVSKHRVPTQGLECCKESQSRTCLEQTMKYKLNTECYHHILFIAAI